MHQIPVPCERSPPMQSKTPRATSPTATSVCSRERPLTGKFRGDPERQELAGQRPSGLNTRGFVVEGRSTTPSRRWHFSGRAPGPLRKRSFASQAEKSPPGDGSRSRVASTARYKHAAERLHLKAANKRCQPEGVIGTAPKQRARSLEPGTMAMQQDRGSPASFLRRIPHCPYFAVSVRCLRREGGHLALLARAHLPTPGGSRHAPRSSSPRNTTCNACRVA